MTPPVDIETVALLIALLEQPDAPDLRSATAGRGSRRTCAAIPWKRERFLARCHAVFVNDRRGLQDSVGRVRKGFQIVNRNRFA